MRTWAAVAEGMSARVRVCLPHKSRRNRRLRRTVTQSGIADVGANSLMSKEL